MAKNREKIAKKSRKNREKIAKIVKNVQKIKFSSTPPRLVERESDGACMKFNRCLSIYSNITRQEVEHSRASAYYTAQGLANQNNCQINK